MQRRLQSHDLILHPASPSLADQVLDYYRKNADFLADFEPLRPDDFYTQEYHRRELAQKELAAAQRTCFQYYIYLKGFPDEVIGAIALNNIIWGCFESCFLSYKLDRTHEGWGLMTQAVRTVTHTALEKFGLHRIEANVMPKNKASLRVLQKCEYLEEGLSKSYLKINGKWEDHIHMVKLREDQSCEQ